MPNWTNTLPDWLLACSLVAALAGLATLGALAMRPIVRRIYGSEDHWHGLTANLLQAGGTFYALLLALIAFAAYGTYTEAAKTVATEAASLSTLYRAISDFPEPKRSELQGLLRDYTDYLTAQAWPAYQRGTVVEGDTALAAQFGKALYTFNPKTAKEQAMNAAALAEFERFADDRRLRHNMVNTGLPAFLWTMLFLGAVSVIGLSWQLPIDSRRAHVLFSAALAIVIAMLLFVVAALDKPFRGELIISPGPYADVRQDLMS